MFCGLQSKKCRKDTPTNLNRSSGATGLFAWILRDNIPCVGHAASVCASKIRACVSFAKLLLLLFFFVSAKSLLHPTVQLLELLQIHGQRQQQCSVACNRTNVEKDTPATVLGRPLWRTRFRRVFRPRNKVRDTLEAST